MSAAGKCKRLVQVVEGLLKTSGLVVSSCTSRTRGEATPARRRGFARGGITSVSRVDYGQNQAWLEPGPPRGAARPSSIGLPTYQLFSRGCNTITPPSRPAGGLGDAVPSPHVLAHRRGPGVNGRQWAPPWRRSKEACAERAMEESGAKCSLAVSLAQQTTTRSAPTCHGRQVPVWSSFFARRTPKNGPAAINRWERQPIIAAELPGAATTQRARFCATGDDRSGPRHGGGAGCFRIASWSNSASKWFKECWRRVKQCLEAGISVGAAVLERLGTGSHARPLGHALRQQH